MRTASLPLTGGDRLAGVGAPAGVPQECVLVFQHLLRGVAARALARRARAVWGGSGLRRQWRQRRRRRRRGWRGRAVFVCSFVCSSARSLSAAHATA